MKNIMVCQSKGGVGKSTTCVLLACALNRAGVKVAIRDMDAQATATRWLRRAPEDGVATVSTAPAKDEARLCIIDTAGQEYFREFMANNAPKADLYLLPLSTNIEEVEIATRTVEILRQFRPDAEMRLLFTRVSTAIKASEYIDEFTKQIGIPRMKNVIPRRADYEYAQFKGYSSISVKNRASWKDLAIEVQSLLY